MSRRECVYPVRMSWIDVVIASLVIISAVRGWSQGVLRQIGGLLGRVLGLVGGVYLAATLSPHFAYFAWRPLDAVLIVTISTVAGGLILRFFGGVFSNRLREGHLGVIDCVLGAGVGIGATLLTCWFVAVLLAVVSWGSLGESINHSVILKYVERVLPTPPDVEGKLQTVLDQTNVPLLFASAVAPHLPSIFHGLLSSSRIATAPEGVVFLESYGGCGVTQRGTGIVVAPDVVLTAAHLLAGEKYVAVDGRIGRVVLFDSRTDVGAVRVVGLKVVPLTLGMEAARGSREQMVGFDGADHRVVSDAVALGEIHAAGRDIYSSVVFARTLDVVATPFSTAETGSPVIFHGAVSAMAVQRTNFGSAQVYAIPVAQLRRDFSRVSSHPVAHGRCVN